MFTFCPICQLPLQAVKISPEIHVNKCLREWDGSNIKECSEGPRCLSTDFYHYIDYTHKALAEYRSSSDFIEPEVEFAKTPQKRKSPKKRFNSPIVLLHRYEGDTANKRSDSDSVEFTKTTEERNFLNSPIVLLHCFEGNTNKSDDDSDSDVFKPTKHVKRNFSVEDYSKSNPVIPNTNLKLARKSRKPLKNNLSRSRRKSNTNQNQISCEEKQQFLNQSQSSVISSPAENSAVKTNADTSFSEKFNIFTASTSMSSMTENVGPDMRNKSNGDNIIINKKTAEVVSENRDKSTKKHSVISNKTTEKLSVNNVTAVRKVRKNLTNSLMKESENNDKTISEKDGNTDLNKSKTNKSFCSNNSLKSTEFFSSASVNALTKEIVTLYNMGSSSSKKLCVNIERIHCEKYDQNNCNPIMQQNRINDTKMNEDVSIQSSALCNENRITSSTTCSVENSTATTINPWFQRKETINVASNSNETERNILHSDIVNSISYRAVPKMSDTKGRKKCPYYKRIPDTCFAVDAFQYGNIPGVRIYFLSHFHADHYGGLTKKFSNPIYCSQITGSGVGGYKPVLAVSSGQRHWVPVWLCGVGISDEVQQSHACTTIIGPRANLVRMKIGVDEKWINVIEFGQTQVIYATEVTALEANHCPGSVMFLFRLRNGRNYLHVGDFRADPKMQTYPELQNIHIEALFLDTTYCNPRYTFRSQEEVVRDCVVFAHKHINNHPKTLFVCGTYTIEALDCKIWAKPEKRRVFACLNDVRINRRITTNNTEAQIHVLSMNEIHFEALSKHLKSLNGVFTHIAAFRPSGWEASKGKNFNMNIKDNVTIYGVPYSEHSNFLELQSFVQSIQPGEVIQTVNVGNTRTRDQVKKYIDEWLHQSPPNGGSSKIVQSKVSSFFQTKKS